MMLLKLSGDKKLIVDIILGNNIDTLMWITELRENGADHIIVIDYDSSEDYKEKDNIIYITPCYAKKYIQKFDSINFYKSLYAYPGMNGSMSSLYNSR